MAPVASRRRTIPATCSAPGCTLQPAIWARWPGLPGPSHAGLIRFGLAATTALTLAMAVPVSAVWPGLRWLAGVTCAIAFVYGTGWCLARLTELGRPGLGGLIFVGPGAGIFVSGLVGTPMSTHHWPGSWAWATFAALGAILTLAVWPVFRGGPERLVAAPSKGAGRPPTDRDGHLRRDGGASRTERWLLAFAYGLAGFGYIITATLLPVIAGPPLVAWRLAGSATAADGFAASLGIAALALLLGALLYGWMIRRYPVAVVI